MANEFDSTLSTPNQPIRPFSYQDLFDAVKTTAPSAGLPAGVVYNPAGGVFNTPDELQSFLTDTKKDPRYQGKSNLEFFYNMNQDKIRGAFQSTTFDNFQNIIAGGMNSAQQAKAAANVVPLAGRAVKPVATFGQPDYQVPNVQEVQTQNKAFEAFGKLAANGAIKTPEGELLDDVYKLSEYLADPQNANAWMIANGAELAKAKINPSQAIQDLTTDPSTSGRSMLVDVMGEKGAALATNYDILNKNVKGFSELGKYLDEFVTNPDATFSLQGIQRVNPETGELEDVQINSLEELQGYLLDLYGSGYINDGYSEDAALEAASNDVAGFLDGVRDKFSQQKYFHLDYQKNMDMWMPFSQGSAPALGKSTLRSQNTYQAEMDRVGYDLLPDEYKGIADAYSYLDELNAQLLDAKNRKDNVVEYTVRDLQSQIDQQQSKIRQMQDKAWTSTGTIYDPVERVAIPASPEVKAAVEKAQSKYTAEYYDRTLFGELKRNRNMLYLEIQDLKKDQEVLMQRIGPMALSGQAEANPTDMANLNMLNQRYLEKVAEYDVLNKGIFTNSNPLKREASFTRATVTAFENELPSFIQNKTFENKMRPDEEASLFANYMQRNGHYVSEQDLQATKQSVGEIVASGLPSTLIAMVEIGAAQMMGNAMMAEVAATKYFTTAKNFFTSQGKLGKAFFEIFVEGGTQFAIQTGAYAVAGQSLAGATGEIVAEKAFEGVVIKDNIEKLLKNKNRMLFVLGKFTSGAVGETVAEVSGNVADLMMEYGYDLSKAVDMTTADGQLAAIGITSLMLTAPGDISLAFKTKQKFAEYIASKGGTSVDPLILEIDRQLDQAIENNQFVLRGETPVMEDIQEPTDAIITPPADSDQAVQPPSSEIPQADLEEANKQEKLAVEQRIANVGEEFHVVEADGTVNKDVVYRYDPETGNLQSKGFSAFNTSFKDVNETLKQEVEGKSKKSGMLSIDKAKQIAKDVLNIGEDSQLIWKDGKFLYSQDGTIKQNKRNVERTKQGAKPLIQRTRERRNKIEEAVFADVEQTSTTSPNVRQVGQADAEFNTFKNLYKSLFGSKMRTNMASMFYNGSKIIKDAQVGIAKVADYTAPLLERFGKIGKNNMLINNVYNNILSSKYFNDAFETLGQSAQDLDQATDIAMTFMSDLLLNDDQFVSEVFGGDQEKINDFNRLRETFNGYVSNEYIGKDKKSTSHAFYNNKMSEARQGLSTREASLKGKEQRVSERERKKITKIGILATGEEYTPEQNAAIRYGDGKITADEFLEILGESTTDMTAEEVEQLAKSKADGLINYEDFKTFEEGFELMASTRKERIKAIKEKLAETFEFELYGADATNIFKAPFKLRQQRNHAANLMNALLEFVAMRSGKDANAILEDEIQFQRITEEVLREKMKARSKNKVQLQADAINDQGIRTGQAITNGNLAYDDRMNGVDPEISYFARGWYTAKQGWAWRDGHPNQPKINTETIDGLSLSADGKVATKKLSDLLNADRLFELFPDLKDVDIDIQLTNINESAFDGKTLFIGLNSENAAIENALMSGVNDMVTKAAGLPTTSNFPIQTGRIILESNFSKFDSPLLTPEFKQVLEQIIELRGQTGDNSLTFISFVDINEYQIQNSLIGNDPVKNLKNRVLLKSFINHFMVQDELAHIFNAGPNNVVKSINTGEGLLDILRMLDENAFNEPDPNGFTVSEVFDAHKRTVVGILSVYANSTNSDITKQKTQKLINRIQSQSSDKSFLFGQEFLDLLENIDENGLKILEDIYKQEQILLSRYELDFFNAVNEGRDGVRGYLDWEDLGIAEYIKLAEKEYSTSPSGIFDAQQARYNSLSEESKKDFDDARNRAFEIAKATQNIDSPEFKKLFGDSKVVDKDGKPLRIYHGTNKLFARENTVGVNYFTTQYLPKAVGYTRLGILSDAVTRDSNVRSGYLKIENPVTIDVKGNNWSRIQIQGIRKASSSIDEKQDVPTSNTDDIVNTIKEEIESGNFEFLPFLQELNPDILSFDASKPVDGVVFKNIKDYINTTDERKVPGDVYVPFSAQQVFTDNVTLFQEDGTIRAAIQKFAKDGKAIIYAVTDPNVSSPVHEMAHLVEDYLTDAEKAVVLEFAGETAWNTNASEAFARGFERYLYEGESPSDSMTKVFEKFKTWLTEIYNALGLSNLGPELNPQMKQLYARIFGETVSEPTEEQVTDESELEGFIESQRKNGMTDEQIYTGLIQSGYHPNDVSEFFEARTKAGVLEQIKGKGDFEGAARAIEDDMVTVRRTLDDIQGMIANMADGDVELLIKALAASNDLDIRVVAAINAMYDKMSKGEDVSQDLEKIANVGTNIGRALQRMKLLKKQPGDYSLATLIREKAKQGARIPKQSLATLKLLAKDFDAKKAEYETAKDLAAKDPIGASRKDPTKSNYEYASVAKDSYEKAKFEFFKALKPHSRGLSWNELYQTLVRGNLLTIGSFVINLTANTVKTIVNLPVNIVASGYSGIKSLLNLNGGISRSYTNRGVGYYSSIAKYGWKKGFQEFAKVARYGSVVEDANGLQISRGFNGFRALRDSFGMLYDVLTGEAKDMSSEEFAAKYNLPLGADGKVIKKAVALRAAEGIFGTTAEFNFRALGTFDAFFRSTAYFGGLHEQAKMLGLKDESSKYQNGKTKYQIFMELNADYSNEAAMDEAMKLIYANEGWLYKVFKSTFASMGGSDNTLLQRLVKSGVTTVIPFQKIPTNVAQEFIQFAVPMIGLMESAHQEAEAAKERKKLSSARLGAQKEKHQAAYRKAKQEAEMAFARAVVGAALNYAAQQMIECFAVSGSASPKAGADEKERRWKNEFRSADHINLTLLKENWNKDPKKRRKDWNTSDEIMELRTFGVLGAILSGRQTFIEKTNRESGKYDLKNIMHNVDKTQNLFYGDIGNSFLYLMDQTMVRNIGDGLDAVMGTQEGKMADFVAGLTNTFVTAMVPNHFNDITKTFREFETVYKASEEDKEMGSAEVWRTTMKNRMNEKFGWLMDSDYNKRYSLTDEPLRQTARKLDPFFELLGFDVPERRLPGIEFDTNMVFDILNDRQAVEWKHVMYLGFQYGGVKSVIPNNNPKTLKLELGLNYSLSDDEVMQYMEMRRPIRKDFVNQAIDGFDWKPLFDLGSEYNQRSDGSKILYGDDNKLMGYVIAGDILSAMYRASDKIVNTTLAPILANKTIAEMTPEERAVLDQIKYENIAGQVIDELYLDEAVVNKLYEAGIRTKSDAINNLLKSTEQAQPQQGPGFVSPGFRRFGE